jgi:hypothetical protein
MWGKINMYILFTFQAQAILMQHKPLKLLGEKSNTDEKQKRD